MKLDWSPLTTILDTLPTGAHYAGIGSRETPRLILKLMTDVAARLDAKGLILRSGGAPGADSAFEAGVPDPLRKQIYLPWRFFNGNPSTRVEPQAEAFKIAQPFHPNWIRLSQAARKLMARNAHQVLGDDLNSPVAFVLCWTKDGTPTGGTGQAIRMAQHYSIPVINFFNLVQREVPAA